MKYLIPAIIVSAVFAVPVASFAQNQPMTRAQVRAELVQLEKAGYHPWAVNRSKYPTDIEAAEARVAAQNGATSYGPAVSGSSQ